MSTQPDDAGAVEVLHLLGHDFAVVPLGELRRLRAAGRHAPAGALEVAEGESVLAAHDEWVAAGRPGARSHDDVMAELLGG
jgi:hypothetical protein